MKETLKKIWRIKFQVTFNKKKKINIFIDVGMNIDRKSIE